MNYRLVINAVALAFLAAAPAAAQPAPEPPHTQSIDVGPQWAYPADSPAFSGTPGVKASWRCWVRPHFGIETGVGWWRRSNTSEFSSPGYQWPGGPMAPAIHGTDTHSVTAYALGIGFLGRIPIGRAAVILGGGPGWFAERGKYDTLISYEPGASNQRYSYNASGSHFGVHTVMELEVRATRRVSVFGGLRSEIRDARYVETMIAYPTAGVRFSF